MSGREHEERIVDELLAVITGEQTESPSIPRADWNVICTSYALIHLANLAQQACHERFMASLAAMA